jgi:hypothetical protein
MDSWNLRQLHLVSQSRGTGRLSLVGLRTAHCGAHLDLTVQKDGKNGTVRSCVLNLIIYLFIYNLFKDAVSSSHYILTNGRTINE